jgi:hypothetical protein
VKGNGIKRNDKCFTFSRWEIDNVVALENENGKSSGVDNNF